MMATNIVITGGTHYNAQTINHVTANSEILKILKEEASPSAFHNSGSRYDPPKCHENTRVAVLKKLEDWIIGSDPETREKWIMWLYGAAGAGKSAIGQTFAGKCDADGRLLASFFFGRSDPTRNNVKFLIPTIACQIYERISNIRDKLLSTIDNDPLFFNKTLLIQLEALVMEPLMQCRGTITQNLIIIDGLDECLDRSSQTAIIGAVFDVVRRHNGHIRFLIASRPEHDIVTAFSLQNNAILARLVLDDRYRPHEDIRLFLNDKIRGIKATHPFRNLIPEEWPENGLVDDIVEKSSGQFIYVSTVIKFIESNRHRPDHRLEIVRNLRPAQGAMPFAELDALYTHILSSVEDIPRAVELLSFLLYASKLGDIVNVVSLEKIHDLERGSLQLIFCDLGALVVIDKDGRIKVLHASLLDFLIDSSRSKDLPISGNALMIKHITNCLGFLSKNPSGENITQIPVEFLQAYVDRLAIFTADMAEAFDGFFLSKFCQDFLRPVRLKHNFLKQINPALLQQIRQSDQHQFLSRYLTMLDESYLVIMDQYPSQALSSQISIMMHADVFPPEALDLSFQLQPFLERQDILGLCGADGNSESRGPTETQRIVLREFLLDPARSKHHNFQSSAPKLYATTLLICFQYLKNILFSQGCPINEICSNVYIHETYNEQMTRPGSRKFGADKTPAHMFGREDPAHLDGDQHRTRDTTNWDEDLDPEIFISPLSVNNLLSQAEDTSGFNRFHAFLRARYYLMLCYMIFFFPRAGESAELIALCKTTVLRQDPRLFPEHTAGAQRAMAAYIKRMAMTMDNNGNSDDHSSSGRCLVYKTTAEMVIHDAESLDQHITAIPETTSDSDNHPILSSDVILPPVPVLSLPMISVPADMHVNPANSASQEPSTVDTQSISGADHEVGEKSKTSSLLGWLWANFGR